MKTFFQYAALVSLSILGVLGILHLGSSLKAPASVGGRWAVQMTVPQGSLPACIPLSPGTGTRELVISQSGPVLAITFNDSRETTLSGNLEGLSIHAVSKHEPVWQLIAEVDREVEPDQLSGTLTSDGCAVPIELMGVRQPHQTSLTGEH